MQHIPSVIKLALGFLALSVTTTFVAADDSAPKERKPSKATLEKYDADKDGQLNEDEKAKAKEGAKEQSKHTREANLAKYDTNKDGKLDKEERSKISAEDKEKMDKAGLTPKKKKAA